MTPLTVSELEAELLAAGMDPDMLARIRDGKTPECFALKRHAATILVGAYLELLASARAEGAMRAENEALRAALENIAEVCNGYGGEAGWACKHARSALAPAGGAEGK